jgi:hypothetical protein
VFARASARNYRRRTRDPLNQIHSWAIAHDAARLAEGIEVEESIHIAFLNAARRKSDSLSNAHRRAPQRERKGLVSR